MTTVVDSYVSIIPSPGRQESVETILAALEVAPEPFRSMASSLVDICAYAGMYTMIGIGV